jgi:hypothetical protein
MVPGEAQIG